MEKLAEALYALTQANQDVRSQAEKYLDSLPADVLIQSQVQCLLFKHSDASMTAVIRSMAAVLLRRKLISGEPAAYEQLSPEAKVSVKHGLLEALPQQDNDSVGSKVCNCLVAVAMCEGTNWSDLIQFLSKLAAPGSPDTLRLYGYWMIGRLYEYCADILEPYHHTAQAILKQGLMDGVLAVQVAAVKATAAAFVNSEAPTGPFSVLVPEILKVLEKCLQTNQADYQTKVLQNLVEVADEDIKFLKPHIRSLIEVTKMLTGEASLSEETRGLAHELACSLVEGAHKIFAKNVDLLKDICNMGMVLMYSIEDDPQWEQEKDNYDTSEDMLVERGQVGLARVADIIDSEILLPVLSQSMGAYTVRPEWKARHTALLAIVQTAEFLEDDHIEGLMPYVVQCLKDENARVRWAACQSVAQLADEHGDDFAETYQATLMPILLERVKDPVPRVVSWACSALRDMCHHLTPELLEPYAHETLSTCLMLLGSGLDFVQEKAVQVVSWVSDVLEERFVPYYQGFEKPLFDLIERPTGGNEIIRGRAMECLTSIGRAVGKEHFHRGAHRFMEMTLHVCDSGVPGHGWRAYYVMHAWKRTSVVLKEEFGPYLAKCVPVMAKVALVDAVIKKEEDEAGRDDPDDEDEDEDDDDENTQWVYNSKGQRRCVNPNVMEDKKSACIAISEICDNTDEAFHPYIQTAVDAMQKLSTFDLDETVQVSAIEALQSLGMSVLVAMKGMPKEQQEAPAKIFIQCLEGVFGAGDSADPEAICATLKAINSLFRLGEPPALPNEYVSKLMNGISHCITLSNDRLKEAWQEKQSNDIDEEEYAHLKEWEHAVMIRVVQCAGAVISNQPFAHTSLLPQIPAFLTGIDAVDEPQQTVSTGMLVEMMKVMPVEAVAQIPVKKLLQIACPGVGSDVGWFFFGLARGIEVRKAALRGVGVWAQRMAGTGNEAIQQVLPHAISGASQLLTSSDWDPTDEDEREVRDIASGCLIRIAEAHSSLIGDFGGMMDAILKWLPIKETEEEEEVCMGFLARMIMSKNMAVMQRLPAVVKVVAGMDKDSCNLSSGLMETLSQIVKDLQTLPAEMQQSCMASLDKDESANMKKWVA